MLIIIIYRRRKLVHNSIFFILILYTYNCVVVNLMINILIVNYCYIEVFYGTVNSKRDLSLENWIVVV